MGAPPSVHLGVSAVESRSRYPGGCTLLYTALWQSGDPVTYLNFRAGSPIEQSGSPVVEGRIGITGDSGVISPVSTAVVKAFPCPYEVYALDERSTGFREDEAALGESQGDAEAQEAAAVTKASLASPANMDVLVELWNDGKGGVDITVTGPLWSIDYHTTFDAIAGKKVYALANAVVAMVQAVL